MPTKLYLDTARTGQMSPGAHALNRSFFSLAAREAGSLRMERFLRYGCEALGRRAIERFPALASWRGVGTLKQSLRRIVGSRPDLPVLFANRSAQLMKFAARLLFSRCLHVLTSDLAWPGYLDILERERIRVNGTLSVLPLRTTILDGKIDQPELVFDFAAKAVALGCDGLFLPAVSNDGVKLPIRSFVRAIEEKRESRFIVVDGAQDFCHASADLYEQHCDLYIAGCHKWLAAYHPMGLAFFGRQRTRRLIERMQSDLSAAGVLDDPLLHFVEQIEKEQMSNYSETVNTSSLFSCAAAVVDAETECRTPPDCLAPLLTNLQAVVSLARQAGWSPIEGKPEFRSGILLLRAERQQTRRRLPVETRAMFQESGIALTTYEGGVIRLSMPHSPFGEGDLNLLRNVLGRTA